jgi:hypothetical protein
MSTCPHELWERENEADSSCPICLRAEIARLQGALKRVRRAVSNDKTKADIDDIAARAIAKAEGGK